MKRYSAKLLFQFRVEAPGGPGHRRTCEERIITFQARGDRAALQKAKTRGQAAEYHYQNDHGNPVFFEFIGVRDMVCLDGLCAPDEVWYDIKKYKDPMERKDALIPSDERLLSRM